MTTLVCPDCDRRHRPGVTGIDAEGRATCLECHTPLRRLEGDGA